MNCFRVLTLCFVPFALTAAIGCSSSSDGGSTGGSSGGNTSSTSTSTSTSSSGSTGGATSSTGGGSGCGPLDNYMPSKAGVTLTDVMAVFTSTATNCSQSLICHGGTPVALGTGNSGFSLDTADHAKAALINVDAFEASMKRVMPGDVSHSFLAHKVAAGDPMKVWGDPLGCMASQCNGMASTNMGGQDPCGVQMPEAVGGTALGNITHEQVITILDWIADGAM